MKFTRRRFLEGIGLLGMTCLLTPGLFLQEKDPPLRPPGAVTEDSFNVKCIRCFKCGEACPTGAIQFGSWLDGQQADTPMLDRLRTNSCNLCMECTKVCPTGALEPIEPTTEFIAASVKIGVARIYTPSCVVYNGQRPVCHICVRICPLKGTAAVIDESGYPVISEQYCVGCGQCEQACPVAAITVGRV